MVINQFSRLFPTPVLLLHVTNKWRNEHWGTTIQPKGRLVKVSCLCCVCLQCHRKS